MCANIVHLMGPTTGGKTAIAIRLARAEHGEIINSDKFYCYRSFACGTGVLDLLEAPDIATHQYGFLDPTQSMISPDEYVRRAVDSIRRVHERGDTAVIDGSSFSFNHALFEHLGRTAGTGYLAVGIRWARPFDVRRSIEVRVDKAFGNGLIAETRAAVEAGLGDTYVMRKGFVYRPVVDFLAGRISLEAVKSDMVEGILGIVASQAGRYEAVRGITWLDRHPGDDGRTVRDVQVAMSSIIAGQGVSRTMELP